MLWLRNFSVVGVRVMFWAWAGGLAGTRAALALTRAALALSHLSCAAVDFHVLQICVPACTVNFQVVHTLFEGSSNRIKAACTC